MNTNINSPITKVQSVKESHSSDWLESILLFGIPSILMLASFHLGIPWLSQIGLSPYEAFITASTLPMAILFAAAIAALIIEQDIDNWSAFRQALKTRMRFPKLTLKAVLLSIGLYILLILFGLVSGFINRYIIQSGMIPLPKDIPLLLDPNASININTITQFVDGKLVGNWTVVILFAVQIFFNVAGEELWWRGFVLPRQELAFGHRAWLIHGLMWWLFHIFKWWDLITVLPLVLIISYAAQRTKNNWIPTIAHLLANSALAIIMLAGVLGKLS